MDSFVQREKENEWKGGYGSTVEEKRERKLTGRVGAVEPQPAGSIDEKRQTRKADLVLRSKGKRAGGTSGFDGDENTTGCAKQKSKTNDN